MSDQPGTFQRLIQFLREVWIELQKVAWPNWEELKSSTVVVVIAVILIAIFIGVVDFGLSRIMRVVFH